jgi:hypothetical protein
MSVPEINIQIIGGNSTKVNTVSGPQRLQASTLPLCDGGKAKKKYVCICWRITVIMTQVSRVILQKIIKKIIPIIICLNTKKHYDQFLLNSTI